MFNRSAACRPCEWVMRRSQPRSFARFSRSSRSPIRTSSVLIRSSTGDWVVVTAATQSLKDPERRSGLLFHRFRGAAHLRANGNGPGRLPHRRNFVDADATDRRRYKLVRNMPVERAGEIGEEGRFEPEVFHDRPDLVEIARREVTSGENVDARGIAAGCGLWHF